MLIASLPTNTTLRLHSNPEATKTIFLDFDGYFSSSSVWEDGGSINLGSFYTTLDSTALTEIQRIWQRVSEDFSPFNINVTTQDPGIDSLTNSGGVDDRWGIRVVFTSNRNNVTGQAIKNAGGGGTAYYNSFNWSTDEPALVFNRGEYTAANTASHEVGHTLNLVHDGNTTTEYYPGHGGIGATSWGTIMGAPWVGNDEVLTQWSRGEYLNSDNTQDDLSTITTGNGFGYRVDDHGNNISSATTLSGTVFNSFGIIETSSDVDLFKFTTGSGLVSFNIENASRAYVNNSGVYEVNYLTSRGPNLDISASILNSSGQVVSVHNPTTATNSVFSTTLAAGEYYLLVDGVGFGNPLATSPTGYTDYGSLGQYMVSGTVQPVAPPPPPDPITEYAFFASSGRFVDRFNFSTPQTVSGGLSNVNTSDNVRMEITEGGHLDSSLRTSVTLHSYQWTFDGLINATHLVFEGYRSVNTNADDFKIQYSANGTNWTNAFNISNTVEESFTFALPSSVNGRVFVRALDSKTGNLDTFYDTLYVDRLHFSSLI